MSKRFPRFRAKWCTYLEFSFRNQPELTRLALFFARRIFATSIAQGELAFEGDVTFWKNEALAELSTQNARGGAIYNAKFGTITFNADLTMTENHAEVSTAVPYVETNQPQQLDTNSKCSDSLSSLALSRETVADRFM